MPPPQARISNIDFLRGLVMIIMALDHTRDFFHETAFTEDPLNLQTTTPALFITRWITHLCAPTFIFLSGTSAYLQSLRKPKNVLSAFLIKRGFWLVLVEVTIMTFGITFDIDFSLIILQVIWAIGVSMILLGLVVRLSFYAVFAIALFIVAGHNVLDYYEANHVGSFPAWYELLHRQAAWKISDDLTILNFYPFLAWAGVMMMGYCFGRFYLSDVVNRHRRTMVLGISLLVFFTIARWLDVYGNPEKWSQQQDFLYTFFSFIDTRKYPPSLLYLSVTLGISLLIMAAMGDIRNRLTRVVEVYGSVPLFYYVLHFYLLHLIAVIVYLWRGHSFTAGLEGSPGSPLNFVVPGEGFGLPLVYLVWLIVVVILYFPCRWYAQYKSTTRKWWLSYL